MLYEYIKTKKLNYMNLFTLIILIVFASLSIYTQDSNFIKMKPTALYCFFAIVLLTGLLRKKIFLRYALGPVLKINDEEWFKLSQIWIVFFIILALLNEIIWRLCDENTWVYSKVFVFPTILLLFIAGQLFFFRKKI
jgi:intracellular septation protein